MLTVELVDSMEKLGSLRKAWNDTLAKSSVDDAHLTWEWFYAWWKNFGREGLFILIVKDSGRFLAIAPFVKQKSRFLGLPVRKISAMRNCYSPRFDIILSERENECMEAILSYLDKEQWDMIELGHIRLESMTLKLLEGYEKKGSFILRRDKARYTSPYISITGDWRDYYAALSKKFKANISYNEKKLNKLYDMTLIEARNQDDINKDLDKFFLIEEAAWKGSSGTAISCFEEVKGFYRDLANLAGENGWISIFFLKANGKEIAADCCLRYKKVMSLQKTGYDPAYSRYSPGVLLKKMVFERIFNDGIYKYDLLGECDDWKMRWTHCAQESAPIRLYRKGAYPVMIYWLQFGIKNLLKRYVLVWNFKVQQMRQSKLCSYAHECSCRACSA
jgi:CelD/BcsL family acetyltransferase involved in cellulose biosynthesis